MGIWIFNGATGGGGLPYKIYSALISQAGAAAPTSPLSTTVNPVSVTIGGMPAQVMFQGLAPGFAGLYQVNAVVPSGIPPASTVPVTLTVAGQTSSPVTMAVQ